MTQLYFSDDQGGNRLPSSVEPRHYELHIEPDLRNAHFQGTVTIMLQIREPTRAITLHAADLKIQDPQVSSSNRGIALESDVQYDEDSQRITLNLRESLPVGSASIKMAFFGELNDHGVGWILSKHQTTKGETEYMMASQMQPIDARRAFPCFDEPALKATFSVSVTADKDMTILGNGDEISSTEHDSGSKTVRFRKTPPMSTYLVALAIGHFKMLESEKFRIPIRTYVPSDSDIEHTRFALDLAIETVKTYEKDFGALFPMPKMDLVTVPGFNGGMENWGLILLTERGLLYDPATADVETKKELVLYITHEIAHQWFGNLVTMDYWEGLWLNESFATWASIYCADLFHPEWHMWEDFLTNEVQDGFALDSIRSTHPVEIPIQRESDIGQIFDDISYQKGSALLRMIASSMDDQVFLEGIRLYMNRHAYSNTRTEDLWIALEEASQINIGEFGRKWTKVAGHPVITVTEKDGKIYIRQNRFMRTGDVKEDEDQTIYPIPLGLRTSDRLDKKMILDQRQMSIAVPADGIFKFNSDHVGFYRTLYSPERLQKLGDAGTQFSVADQAGLISDAAALAAAGSYETSRVLAFVEKFKGSNNYFVWKQIMAFVSSVQAAWIFEPEDSRQALDTFQRDLVSSKTHEIGWEFGDDNDDPIQQRLKALLFDAAAQAGDEKVLAAASEMFEKYMAGDRTVIHPSIRTAVFSAVVSNVEDADKAYDRILADFRSVKTDSERITALKALGAARKPELMKRTCALMTSDTTRRNEGPQPLDQLVHHPGGIKAAWSWFTSDFEEIKEKYFHGLGGGSRILITALISSPTSEKQIAEMQKFFADKKTDDFDLLLEQGYDEVRVKAGWLERGREDVKKWLKARTASS